MRATNHIHCDNCNTLTVTKVKSKHTLKHKGKKYVVNDFPIEECPKCGLVYYDGPTLERIEKEIEKGRFQPLKKAS